MENITFKHQLFLKNSIKTFEKNYLSYDYERIQREVNKILIYPGYSVIPNGSFAIYNDNQITKNVVFCRARFMSDDKNIKDVNQYWNLPEEKVLSFGRLNLKNESVLYTTHTSFLTSLREIEAEVGDDVVLITYKRLSGLDIICKNMIILDLQFLNKPNPISKLSNLKYKFINDWITKKDKGNEKLYFVTNAIKNFYVNTRDKNECSGLIYPSLFSNTNYNLIFFGQKAKSLLFIDNIYYGKIIELNERYFHLQQEYKFVCVQNESVIWEKYDKPQIMMSYL